MSYRLSFIFLFWIQYGFAQEIIRGLITDHHHIPLEGVVVKEKGENNKVATNKSGEFEIEVKQVTGVLKINFLGFKPESIIYKNGEELTAIALQPEDYTLDEVRLIGKGVVDLEKDRKTPTAVSTVTREEIQLRTAGNVEFPNTLKNTPSAYISSESAGFGDGQLFLRGFDQSNTAFLLNGQPVNGMQNGRLFWSNWNGLTDIVNAVQVQRGLGSSKLAVSSAGGTVNMITKATERHQGGFARFLAGNDSFFEGTVAYDTGVNENGWGFSLLLDYWKAHKKYAQGTKGEGQNYFFSIGKKAGNHNFNLLLTGAPLIHDQNPAKSMELYKEYGREYNNQYGYRNGKYLAEQRKFYHKPIFNFNWDWDIDEGSNLSTVLYASLGHGGGTMIHGQELSSVDYVTDATDPIQIGPFKASDGLIDWDFIEQQNNAGLVYSQGSEGVMLASSINNNQYYGGVINYEITKIPNLDINIGADIRFYRDNHFKQLIDKLGLEGRIENFGGNPNHTITKTYKADPWSVLFNNADRHNRIGYDYSENINYQGGFGQVEWMKNSVSAFVQGSFSNQSYKRQDRGNFEYTKVSDILHKTGYNLKGGASWEVIDNHSLYANLGKFSRQPFLNDMYTSFSDRTMVTEEKARNEEIIGAEAGYRYSTDYFKIRLDAYYTKWQNRLLTTESAYDPDGDYTNPQIRNATYFFGNIAQLHQGLELEAEWQASTDIFIHAFGSLGKWEYDGSTPVVIRNEADQNQVAELETDLQNTKVGQAPQTSAGLGIDYQIIPGVLQIYSNWNYYSSFYGFVDVGKAALSTLRNESYKAEKLNSYSLVDFGAVYNLRIDNQRFQLAGNVYNLLNHQYISQRNNSGYYMGNGRTYNIAVKYFF